MKTRYIYLLIAILTVIVTGCAQSKPGNEVLFNEGASLPANFVFDPMEWKVIGSAINKNTHTMSTLYGNDIAVNHARTNDEHHYPNGAALSLVTWLQKEDAHWFGGSIPSTVLSVELLQYNAVAGDGLQTAYAIYKGNGLSKQPQPVDVAGRIALMIAQKASVLP